MTPEQWSQWGGWILEWQATLKGAQSADVREMAETALAVGAIVQAAREYAAANSEVYEHAWTPQAWQRRRQAHDALIEAVGEVAT